MSEGVDRAIESVMSGENTFISGPGGTGKSTLIGTLMDFLREDTVILSTTGLSALSIGGMTVHRALGLPLTIPTPSCHKTLDKGRLSKIRKLFGKNSPVNRIILDEAGMLSAAQIVFVDRMLRFVRQSKEMFGGLQIVLLGDLLQLGAVIRPNERVIMNKEFKGTRFFETATYKHSGFNLVQLTKLFRQKDPTFGAVLGRVREGGCTQQDLDYLNQRVSPIKYVGDSVIACSTNKEVDNINQMMVKGNNNPPKVYKGVNKGFNPSELPIPEEVLLKEGLRVMICANKEKVNPNSNKPEGWSYVNGDTGTIVGMHTDFVRVRLDKGGEVSVGLFSYIKEETRIAKDGSLFKVKIGEYQQLPIKVAYAMSIHKSQGQTLDKIHLDLGRRAFCTGLTYVGLSRVKTLEGLTLQRPITMSDILVDKVSLEYLMNN